MITTQVLKQMSAYLHSNVILWTLLYLILAGLSTTYAQPTASNEYQLKAAFLYGLIKMVEWPAEDPQSTEPLTLCFYGEDAFGDALDTIRNKKVKKRPLSLKTDTTLSDVTQCQVLFINKSAINQLARILRTMNNQPVLTVSDIDKFAERGGMVNLLKEGDSIKLMINLCATKQVGLTISSRVLALAKIVTNQQLKDCR